MDWRGVKPVRTDLFDYEIPEGLIAQMPLEERDKCKLLVLDPIEGTIDHTIFSDLPSFLNPGDLLILNDTKVVKAMIRARKAESGGSIELLIVDWGGKEFRALARGRKIRKGTELEIGNGAARIKVVEKGSDGTWILEGSMKVDEMMESFGRIPLPPYIKPPRVADERLEMGYQTVYAANYGSVAAPTAGLHFTEDLLGRIKDIDVEIGFLTLHIGPGTFKLIRSEMVEEHLMDSEWFEIPEETADLIRRAKGRGGRVIAVGTTTVRALESCGMPDGTVIPGKRRTDLFIYPGYKFKVVDAMITNFHLPRSTPLILVCAFAGRENIFKAYEEAIRMGYRFYSFGDAMFIKRGVGDMGPWSSR